MHITLWRQQYTLARGPLSILEQLLESLTVKGVGFRLEGSDPSLPFDNVSGFD